MWVLAVDTATPMPGVALAGEGFEKGARLPKGRQASEALLGCLETMLSAARLSFPDIGRLAVCSGPGSFTGIRVGLATVWGLARALAIPIETFGALEAVAELARTTGGRRICPSFDAERGEVYFGQFDLDGPRAREIAPPIILARESAPGSCPRGALLFPLDPGEAGPRIPALAAGRKS